ncbi:MAG: hypothetical protein AAGI63_04870 [Planctomycetota bacterium]
MRKFAKFSLRALLVFTAIAGITFAVIRRRVKAQQAVVDLVERNGGHLRYDYSFPSGIQNGVNATFDANAESSTPKFLTDLFGVDLFHSIVFVSLDAPQDDTHESSDEALEILGRLPSLYSLEFDSRSVRDESLAHLHGLRNLRHLRMIYAPISDDGIRQLSPLKQLREVLFEAETDISDAGMQTLGSLPSIEYINVRSSSLSNAGLRALADSRTLRGIYVSNAPGKITVDDEGMKHLSGLENLEMLVLFESSVTDEGLVHLESLKKLKNLNLGSPDVTQDAKTTLINKIPGLKIHF